MPNSKCCPPPCPTITIRAMPSCPQPQKGSEGGCCPPPCCRDDENIQFPMACCDKVCGDCPPPCCNRRPVCCDGGDGKRELNRKCPAGKNRREKRWKQCNFLKPCIDTRIYRNGEALCITYAGHIPGEQFIHGRNLPTITTYAKRRLCQYTPYEFIDPDGCCSFCNYP